MKKKKKKKKKFSIKFEEKDNPAFTPSIMPTWEKNNQRFPVIVKPDFKAT